eukprot:1839177-Amphidinium_carterae.1
MLHTLDLHGVASSEFPEHHVIWGFAVRQQRSPTHNHHVLPPLRHNVLKHHHRLAQEARSAVLALSAEDAAL